MDKFYYVSLVLVGILMLALTFFPDHQIIKKRRICFVVLVAFLLYFQGWYLYQEKKKADIKDSRDQFEISQLPLRVKEEISEDIKEREKKKGGLLTDVEYGRYIALYLERINLAIEGIRRKNMRELVTAYHDAVGKIPAYFSFDEWRADEKFIYDSFVDEINGNFNSRNMYNSGVRQKALEDFKKERDRLLSAKEREFNRAK